MIEDHLPLSETPPEFECTSVIPPKNQGLVQDLLFWLTEFLHQKYHQSVIILVDEYDTPLNHAFQKGFYDQASRFFETFFSQALKGNSALKKACLVGIVEMRGAGILSGLDNYTVYSVDKTRYEACFGFTCDEMKGMLHSKNKSGSYDEIMRWYNGYHIGNMTVINPWSVVNTINDGFDSYWVKSSSTETLSTLLGPFVEPKLIASISTLMVTEKLEISPLSSEVNYSKENWDHDSIMHFLVLTGYLTYQSKATTGEVWIPNHELLKESKSDILRLLYRKFGAMFERELFGVLSDPDFDPVALQEVMHRILLHCSSHVLNHRNESLHPMFYYGIFSALFLHDKQIQLSAGRESGFEGNVIQILLMALKMCFIIEFKVSAMEDHLDRDAEIALEQIIDKKYATNSLYMGFTCIGVGIGCYNKSLSQIKWCFLFSGST